MQNILKPNQHKSPNRSPPYPQPLFSPLSSNPDYYDCGKYMYIVYCTFVTIIIHTYLLPLFCFFTDNHNPSDMVISNQSVEVISNQSVEYSNNDTTESTRMDVYSGASIIPSNIQTAVLPLKLISAQTCTLVGCFGL